MGVLVLVVCRETEMDHDSIYRRLLDITIELSRLLLDIKESENPQSSGGCLTILQLMQESHHAVLEHNRCVFEETVVFVKKYVIEIKNWSVL